MRDKELRGAGGECAGYRHSHPGSRILELLIYSTVAFSGLVQGSENPAMPNLSWVNPDLKAGS